MNRTAWNLLELRSRVRVLQSNPDQTLELISSIERNIRIFRYHIATARDAFNGIINDAEPQGPENLKLFIGLSDRQEDFAIARIVSEANVIGCLHTARNLWDLFGQLVNSLVLVTPLASRVANIHSVAAAMPPSALKDRLNALLSSHWFKYVVAFSNTTKHRQLVPHVMTVSVEQNRVGFQVAAFRYDSKSFRDYWGHEVLDGAIEVQNAILDCGQLLNVACGA